MIKQLKYFGIMTVALLAIGAHQEASASPDFFLPQTAAQAGHASAGLGLSLPSLGGGVSNAALANAGIVAGAMVLGTSGALGDDVADITKSVGKKQLIKAKVDLAKVAKKEVKSVGAGFLNNAVGNVANASGTITGAGITKAITSKFPGAASGVSASGALGKAGIGLVTGTTNPSQIAGAAIKNVTGSVGSVIKGGGTGIIPISTPSLVPPKTTITVPASGRNIVAGDVPGKPGNVVNVSNEMPAISNGMSNSISTGKASTSSGTAYASNGMVCPGKSNSSGWTTQ